MHKGGLALQAESESCRDPTCGVSRPSPLVQDRCWLFTLEHALVCTLTYHSASWMSWSGLLPHPGCCLWGCNIALNTRPHPAKLLHGSLQPTPTLTYPT